LPVLIYSFLISGTTLMWKFAQCGQVKDEKILILTGASSCPRTTELIFVAILPE
jgi:hypothetical protein